MNGKISVLIEVKTVDNDSKSLQQQFSTMSKNLDNVDLEFDSSYQPIPMSDSLGFNLEESTYIVRASLNKDDLNKLKNNSNVVDV